MLRVMEEIFADAYAGINAFGAHAEQLQDIVRPWVQENMLPQARKQANGTRQTNGPNEVRFSIEQQFYDDFDAWVADGARDTNKVFTVGNTSDVLQSIGVKDQKVKLRSGTVLQKLSKHPELTTDIFKSIPELLENPVIVQFSDAIDPKTGKPKYDSRITVLGELYAEIEREGEKKNAPVLVALELLPTNQKNTQVLDFNIVVSAYGHSKLQNYLNENSILYIDPNKKRTDNWLSLNRLQLPLGENQYGSIRRIAYADGKVKVQNSTKKTDMQIAMEKAGLIDSFGRQKQKPTTSKTTKPDYRFSMESMDEEEIAERQAQGTDKIAPTQQELERERQAWAQKANDGEPTRPERKWYFDQRDAEQERQYRLQTEYYERNRKPENKPVIAKQRLVKSLFDTFSIPTEDRDEIRTVIENFADRMQRKGGVQQEDLQDLFDRLYASGVMTLEADEYSSYARSMIARGRIYVSDSVKAEFGDDWADFRKRYYFCFDTKQKTRTVPLGLCRFSLYQLVLFINVTRLYGPRSCYSFSLAGL